MYPTRVVKRFFIIVPDSESVRGRPQVGRDPNGKFAIQTVGDLFLMDLDRVWCESPQKAATFATLEDAITIAAGLWSSKAIIGGERTYSLSFNGNPLPMVRIVEFA